MSSGMVLRAGGENGFITRLTSKLELCRAEYYLMDHLAANLGILMQ